MHQRLPKKEEDNEGWWTRERTLALALFLITALAFGLCYLLARPFLTTLAWALALAIVAHPVHVWLARKVPFPNLAAGLTVALVALTLVAPTVFVVDRLVREAMSALEQIRTEGVSDKWRELTERNPRLAPLMVWVQNQVDFRDTADRLATALAEEAQSFLRGSVWGTIELLVTFFFLFYFFRDRPIFLGFLRSLMPLSHRETDEVFRRVKDTIHATIYGTIDLFNR